MATVDDAHTHTHTYMHAYTHTQSLVSMCGQVVKGVTSATVGWMYHSDKRPDPDCWLRSGYEPPQGRIVLSNYRIPLAMDTSLERHYMCLAWIEGQ